MKKTLIILTLCCFSLAILAMNPAPVLAADDPTVPIVVGSVLGFGLLLGLILMSNSSGEQEMKDLYNPKLHVWTYDNMILQKGQPTMVTEINSSTLAQYYNAKNISVGSTVYHKSGFLTEASSDTESQMVTRFYGEKFWFYFDNNKTLIGWMYSKMAPTGESAIWNAMGGDLSFINAANSGNSKAVSAAQRPISAPGATINPAAGGKTLEQKLKELKDLKDKKLITDKDYETTKQKLLDNAVK